MFYDTFLQLCDEKGVKPTPAALAMGFSKATATKWKNGSVPSSETLQIVADYFGVSVDYLLNGETKKSPDLTAENDEVKRLQNDERFIRLQRAVSRMDDSTKDRAIKTLEAAFEEFFSDDYIDTDTEE